MYIETKEIWDIYIPWPFERTAKVDISISENKERFIEVDGILRKIFESFPYFERDRSKFTLISMGENRIGWLRFKVLECQECVYNTEVALSKIFDIENLDYVEKIKQNPVQVYMRLRTKVLLEKYGKDNWKVLDLGSGPEPETLVLIPRSTVYIYDISKVAIELAKNKDNRIRTIEKEGLLDEKEKIDMVFTSFGYIEIAGLDFLREIIDKKLRVGGILIACFLNRFGVLDIILNLIQFRFQYVMEKFSGHIFGNFSRYSLGIRLRKMSEFEKIGMKIIDVESICTIMPPYYYSKLINKLNIERIQKIDEKLSKLPLFNRLGDFICIVGVKV